MIRILRSIAINVAFYLSTTFWVLFMLPSLFLKPPGYVIWCSSRWARTNLFLFRLFGLKAEFRGLERIPAGGLLVASKHQSAWETFAITIPFPRITYVFKKELKYIPFFGWLLVAGDQIPIDRSGGRTLMESIVEGARRAIAKGRHFTIYPEGTRRPVDAPPAYKYGVTEIYRNIDVPCVPVAHNAGLFWPRRTFFREPGTIIMEVLEPIPPGLPPEEFAALLQQTIEDATNRLVAEGRAEIAKMRANA